jgi:hypothetical protein
VSKLLELEVVLYDTLLRQQKQQNKMASFSFFILWGLILKDKKRDAAIFYSVVL